MKYCITEIQWSGEGSDSLPTELSLNLGTLLTLHDISYHLQSEGVMMSGNPSVRVASYKVGYLEAKPKEL